MAKNGRKWLRRTAFGAAAAIVFLLFALLLTLSSTSTYRWVADTVQTAAGEALNGSLTIGAVEGSALTELRLRDVALVDADGALVAHIDSVTTSVALANLPLRSVVLDVEIDAPTVVVRRHEDGVLNLSRLTKPSDEPAADLPVDVDIAWNITNGTVVYADHPALPAGVTATMLEAPNGQTISALAETAAASDALGAPGLALLTSLAGGGRVTVSKVKRIEIAAGETNALLAAHGLSGARRVAISDVRANLDAQQTVASIEALAIQRVVTATAIRARVDASGSHTSEADVVIDREFLRALAPDASFRAGLVGRVAIGGAADQLRVAATIQPDPGEGDLALTFRLADLQGEAPAWDIAAVTRGLVPEKVAAAAEFVSGANIAVVASGKGFDRDLTSTLAANITDVRVGDYSVEALGVRAGTSGRRLEVERWRVQSPYLSGSGAASLAEDGAFTATAALGSNDAFEQVARLVLKRDLEVRADVEASARGRLDLAAEPGMTMIETAQVSARWDLDRFEAETLRVASSAGRITASVTARDDGKAALELTAKAHAESVRLGEQSLTRAAIDARAKTVAAWPTTDARELLDRLRSDLAVEVAGLNTDNLRLRRLSARSTTRPGGSGALDWTLESSFAGFSAGGTRAAEGAARLGGDVTLGPELAWPGGLTALSAKGGVSVKGVAVGGDRAGYIDAKVDISGPRIDLRGSVSASGADLAVGNFEFGSLAGRLELVGDRRFVIDAQGTQTEDRKPKELAATIKGRHSADLTRYEITSVDIRSLGEGWSLSDGFSLATREGAATFEDVELSRTSDDGGKETVRVHGHYRSGHDQDLTARFENVRIGALLKDVGAPSGEHLRGRVSGHAAVAGTAREPTADFDLEFTDLYWKELGPFSARIAGRYRDRVATITKLSVEGYGTRLLDANATLPVHVDASGRYDVQWNGDLRVFANIPTLPLENGHPAVEFLRQNAVTGWIQALVTISGTPAHPVAEVGFKASKLTSVGEIDGEPFSVGPADLAFRASYRPGDEAGGAFSLSGDFAWTDQPQTALSARIDAPIARWIRDAVEGKDVDFEQRLSQSPFEVSVKTTDFDLRHLRVGPLRAADVEGLVTMDFRTSGTLAEPGADLVLSVRDFGWNRYRDVELDVRGRLRNNVVALSGLRLGWDGDEILSGRASFPLPFDVVFGDAELADMPLGAQLQLEPIALNKFSAVDYSFASLRGTFSGFLSIVGTLRRPLLNGRLSAVDTVFSDKSVGTVAMEFSARDRLLRADLTFCRGPRETLAASASLPVETDLVALMQAGEPLIEGPLAGTVVGKRVRLAGLVPRKVFDDYFEDVRGTMDVDLTLGGTTAAPTLAGAMTVTGGGLSLPGLARRLDDFTLDVSFKPGQIELRELFMQEGDGYVDVKGALAVEGTRPRDLTLDLTLNRFGTAGFSEIPLFVSANVTASGDLAAETALAKARVRDTEVILPDAAGEDVLPLTLDEDIVVVRKQRSRGAGLFASDDSDDEAAASDEPYARIEIEIEDNSWGRHPAGEVEFAGDLRLALAPAGPTIEGEVRTLQGKVEVLGKTFAVQPGLVTFSAENPPDPKLQLEAHHVLDRKVTANVGQPISGVPHAIVRVTGRASDPDVRFLSDPAMSEPDVIYVLLTNQAPGQAEVGQAEAGSLAAGAASGIASGMMKDKLGEYSPVKLDVVKLEAGERGFSDPRLEVGKYLGPNVFVSIERKFGAEEDENTVEVNFEFRLSTRWILELEAGNRSTGEANLFWDVY